MYLSFSKVNTFYLENLILYLENRNLTKNIVKLHNYVCEEGGYFNDFGCLSGLLTKIDSEESFIKALIDGFIIYL